MYLRGFAPRPGGPTGGPGPGKGAHCSNESTNPKWAGNAMFRPSGGPSPTSGLPAQQSFAFSVDEPLERRSRSMIFCQILRERPVVSAST